MDVGVFGDTSYEKNDVQKIVTEGDPFIRCSHVSKCCDGILCDDDTLFPSLLVIFP